LAQAMHIIQHDCLTLDNACFAALPTKKD